MNKKGTNPPLVYITESLVQDTSRKMQQSFYSRPNKKVKKAAQEVEAQAQQQVEEKQAPEQREQKPVVEQRQHVFEEVTKQSIYEELEQLQEDVPVQAQIVEEPVVQQTTQQATEEVELKEESPAEEVLEEDEEVIARKAFKDMSMEEKVLFILARPHYIPKVKCRVNTRRNWYIGYIAQLKDNIVYLKIPTRLEPISLRLDDIQSIQMIGTHES